jgi:predicted enzyme related to lactoylglutathione lyase
MIMYVQFVELPVFDQDRAVAFYTQKFGGEVATDKPYGGDSWRWIEIAIPGGQTRLLFSRRGNSEPSNTPSMVIVEGDIHRMIESLRSKGVEIITEPGLAPWEPGRLVAEFRDSEGNRIVIGTA